MNGARLFWQAILIVAFAAVGTLFAAQTGDSLKPQGDFKHWYRGGIVSFSLQALATTATRGFNSSSHH